MLLWDSRSAEMAALVSRLRRCRGRPKYAHTTAKTEFLQVKLQVKIPQRQLEPLHALTDGAEEFDRTEGHTRFRPLSSRPARPLNDNFRERRGPPKHAEIRVRRSFNGTESGTEFPGRCLYALCEAGPGEFDFFLRQRWKGRTPLSARHDGRR